MDEFEAHVPCSDAAYLVLKAHLVVELRLLEFIKARTTPELFKEIERQREGAFNVKLLLARVLAERDEIPQDNANILWLALDKLGKLRNDVAHILVHKGTSLEDKMCDFVKIVDPMGELFGQSIPAPDLLRSFRLAASYLNSLLTISCVPLLISDELVVPFNG